MVRIASIELHVLAYDLFYDLGVDIAGEVFLSHKHDVLEVASCQVNAIVEELLPCLL